MITRCTAALAACRTAAPGATACPGTGRPATAAGHGTRGAALALLDGRDELALAHPGGAGHAQGLREALQLGQQHRAEPAAAARPGRRCITGRIRLAVPGSHGAHGARRLRRSPSRCRRVPCRCGRRKEGGRLLGGARGAGENFGGVAHEGSFPRRGRRLRSRPVNPLSRPG